MSHQASKSMAYDSCLMHHAPTAHLLQNLLLINSNKKRGVASVRGSLPSNSGGWQGRHPSSGEGTGTAAIPFFFVSS